MRDVLLALFLLSAFPVILYRFQVGAMVIGFISFMYPQSNTFGFAVTIQWLDYFVAVTLLGYIIRKGYKDYTHHNIISLLIVFYLWICLTTLFAIDSDVSYEGWLKYTKILIITFIFYAMLGTEIRVKAFIKVMVLSIGFYGIKGGVFTIMTGGSYQVLGPINSFFASNNETALVLTMALPFMVFFTAHADNIYQRYFSLFCSLTTAVAILGTHSRTGLVALVITLLYFTWLQKKIFRATLILVPVACIAYFFMPENWSSRMGTTTDIGSDISFLGRVDMWKASLRIAADHPVFGGGFDVIYIPEVIAQYIPLDTTARAIHSAYFQMIAEHGYGGLLIYAFIILSIFIASRRISKQARKIDTLPWIHDLTIAVRCSITGYLVMGITNNIAFFDLLYVVIILLALADNILQKELNVSQSYQPELKDLRGLRNSFR